jgi:hypothetical protein
MAKADGKRTPLSKKRHPQKDFFVADIMDASFKDDVASMEHPLFALKSGEAMPPLRYSQALRGWLPSTIKMCGSTASAS